MFKEKFTANIKRARLNSKMTQQEVADILNTSRSNITKYENGILEPNIETIGLLAELYKVSTDWLFGIIKPTDTNMSNISINQSNNNKAIVKINK